jgi:2-dehydropantoate 2-reductase
MRIAIVGSGALGSVVGGMLQEAGEEVFLIDVWEEHIEAMNRYGLQLNTDGGEKRNIKVVASNWDYQLGKMDLVICLVKAPDTIVAMESAKKLLKDDTIVLTLQNGYGNIEKISEVIEKERIIAGVTTRSATVLEPGKVKHSGRGMTYIGEIDGETTPRLRLVEKLLNKAGFAVTIVENMEKLLWSKLMINVAVNPLTALTGLYNCELVEYEETRQLAQMVIDEAFSLAKARGTEVMFENPYETFLEVAKGTGRNYSSMLQDLRRGRKTEIDVISGAIVKEGERLGIPTPINKALMLLVKAVENSGGCIGV